MPSDSRPRVPEADLEPLQDDDFLVENLSAITQQKSETVRQRLERERSELGTNVSEALAAWKLTPFEWSDRLADFYAQTDGFLFETLVWNRHPAKLRMRQWIAEYLGRNSDVPQTILTYGDGLGIDSIFLTQAGHSVDYFEISKHCIDFSRRLAQRMNVEIGVISSPDDIPLGNYDVVVCLDVLEHVPDPPAVVAKMASYLRTGGILIVHSPFWYIHRSVATHLKANRKFSGDWKSLYLPHGFKLVDGRFLWLPIILEKTPPGARTKAMSLAVRIKLTLSSLVLRSARYWSWPLSFLANHKVRRAG